MGVIKSTWWTIIVETVVFSGQFSTEFLFTGTVTFGSVFISVQFYNKIFLIPILVILSIFTEETEARRKILRGRRTVTRRYNRKYFQQSTSNPNETLNFFFILKGGLAIPAWTICVIVGLCNLLVGGILYLVMRKVVLSDSDSSANTYSPALMSDA